MGGSSEKERRHDGEGAPDQKCESARGIIGTTPTIVNPSERVLCGLAEALLGSRASARGLDIAIAGWRPGHELGEQVLRDVGDLVDGPCERGLVRLGRLL